MGVTDRELMEQALEAMKEINKLSVGENAICLPAEIDGAMDALRERLARPEPVQVSPLEFVEMVMEKEHLVGKPIIWAEWPNKERI